MKPFLAAALFFLAGLPISTKAASDTSFTETPVTLHTPTGDLFGTLTLPDAMAKPGAVALIIAGSGPTDRNGNNPFAKNAGLQQLAHALAAAHIPSLRFDKRGIGESAKAGKSEADMRFEDYIADAAGWIKLLKADKRFSKVVVVGHSEGSLIGAIAAGQEKADAFVSIAGAGNPAGKTIRDQVAAQPKEVQDLCYPILDSLAAGKTVADVNPMVYMSFRPSVQPYLISWFRYDPAAEVRKLNIPTLMIGGTRDLQVPAADAQILAKASTRSSLVLIEGMNHILRLVPTDDQTANFATYNNAALPISEELVRSIAAFIGKI